MVVVNTDISSRFVSGIMEKYTDQIRRAEGGDVSAACRENGASPLLDIAETCPEVRVRRTVTEDAVLWFIHNRGEEINVNINAFGNYTIFAADGAETSVKSDGNFRLTLPEKSAVMLVRQKGDGDEIR